MNLGFRHLLSALAIITLLAACGKKSSSDDGANEDTSASSVAAESIGGALNGSSSNGTLARYDLPTSIFARVRSEMSPLPRALAQALCPTFQSTDSTCSTSGGDMWLAYSGCSFAGRASWNGTQLLEMSTGTATCGSFPNPGASQVLYRQFVQSANSTTPGSLTLTAGGYEGTVDDATANLGNFDNQSLSTIVNGGYGIAVHFAADGSRSSISFGHHLSISGLMDHSVYGQNISVTESPGSSTRTVSGTVTVYHNRVNVIGTVTFSGLTHSDTCCVPLEGTITTTFARGTTSPTLLGEKMIGKTETLAFNGTCGSATLTSTDGSTKDVTLKRCF